MKRVTGLRRHPRLIEFQNSRFSTEDFRAENIDYLTVTNDTDQPLEFARTKVWRWETPQGETITVGEVIKRIYSHCKPEAYLHLYVTDTNPSCPRLMQLKKILTYRLTVGDTFTDKSNRVKQGYNFEIVDDAKVFHSLKQFWELEYP